MCQCVRVLAATGVPLHVQEKRNSDGSLGSQLRLERKEVWNLKWAEVRAMLYVHVRGSRQLL